MKITEGQKKMRPYGDGPCGCPSERGDETETREEAYGDPIPQNVKFLDQKSKAPSNGGWIGAFLPPPVSLPVRPHSSNTNNNKVHSRQLLES